MSTAAADWVLGLQGLKQRLTGASRSSNPGDPWLMEGQKRWAEQVPDEWLQFHIASSLFSFLKNVLCNLLSHSCYICSTCFYSKPIFFFNHSFILHRLGNRTRPISTPYDGRHWWDSNPHTTAWEDKLRSRVDGYGKGWQGQICKATWMTSNWWKRRRGKQLTEWKRLRRSARYTNMCFIKLSFRCTFFLFFCFFFVFCICTFPILNLHNSLNCLRILLCPASSIAFWRRVKMCTYWTVTMQFASNYRWPHANTD